MTLRISIGIVPFGDEENKYEIFRIDVSNQGTVRNLGFGHEICKYKAELFRKNTEVMQELLNYSEWTKEGEFIVEEHDRRDGAIELARKVTAALSDENENGVSDD